MKSGYQLQLRSFIEFQLLCCMRHFIAFLFILLSGSSFLAAQPAWTVYLGADMDSLYNIEYCSIEKENNFSYLRVYGFNRFIHYSETTDKNYEENRLGLVWTAKNTQRYIAREEIIFGKANDSVKIVFTSRTDVVTHGRSAALSVLNLFSKRRDKVKQDEPYEEITYREMNGVIIYGNDSCRFFCSEGSKNKNADKWLILHADTLRMIPAQLYHKTKNGTIKNRSTSNGGWQLMKGQTCLAALDKNEHPMILCLRKEMSEKIRLIITAFFVIRSLEKFV